MRAEPLVKTVWSHLLHLGDVCGKLTTLIALPSAIFAILVFYNEIGDTLTSPNVSADIESVGLRCGPAIDGIPTAGETLNAFRIRKCNESLLSAWVKLEIENEDSINRTLVKAFRVSITFDNDLGFAMHSHLKSRFGMKTYFCDAYASWQKGGVENANGRLRYWIPKRADLSKFTDDDIEEITMKMNLLPRKCLNWKTPLQVWAEHANRNLTIKFA